MKLECPVCKTEAEVANPSGFASLECKRCGTFQISDLNRFKTVVWDWSETQRVNLSGWIRENQGCKLASIDLEGLANLRTPTFGEKARRLMVYYAKAHPKPGEYIYEFNPSIQLLGVCWAQDLEELSFILIKYLVREREFLEQTHDGYAKDCLRITTKGWSYLDEVLHEPNTSRVGFIAMWFHESMNDAWKAIDLGIRDAGYEPLRIDQKQHNNKIDDEIVAAIRRSKFVVADFTKQRGGVYFEAGFAKGLNLEVVWLCRHDDLKEVHFDTRQYNFVVWEADKLAELSKSLKDRIEAKFGHGPL